MYVNFTTHGEEIWNLFLPPPFLPPMRQNFPRSNFWCVFRKSRKSSRKLYEETQRKIIAVKIVKTSGRKQWERRSISLKLKGAVCSEVFLQTWLYWVLPLPPYLNGTIPNWTVYFIKVTTTFFFINITIFKFKRYLYSFIVFLLVFLKIPFISN